MNKQTTKDIYDIEPIAAIAVGIVEHGQVDTIIDGYKFEFTVQEYSNGIFRVLLDSDFPKARKILKTYGAKFTKKELDEIQGEKFKQRIKDIYEYSSSKGGSSCSWKIENYNELEYKEF